MKDYLEFAKKTKYLDLGNFRFSPIIQCTTAIALDYALLVSQHKEKKAMLFTLPIRNECALWISVQFLINCFFENYIYQSENRIKELNLRGGDKIDIFSTTAIFQRLNTKDNKILIKFADGAIAHSNFQNIQFINKAKKKMVNKYAHYVKKKKVFLSERKSLTKILGLDSNPNFEALSSKVVLITGRGKAGIFRRNLKKIKIYDEDLSETIMLDKNLLLSPDFSCFQGSVKSDSNKNTVFFIKAVKQILTSINCNEPSLHRMFDECLKLVDTGLKTKKFIDNFQALYSKLLQDSIYESTGYKLQSLMKYHPGIEDDLINDVSAVFVNDLQLVLENQKMINFLANHNIPVFIIGDRVINDFNELDIYKTIFNKESFKDVYRFNWNKQKVIDLGLEIDDGSNFIDYNSNNLFYRFTNQKINITELDYNEFDEIFNSFESKRFLSTLGDLELLQKAYYQILRPLLYSIKNSIDRPDSIKLVNLIDSFVDVLEQSSEGLNKEIKLSINNSLYKLKMYILSGKQPKDYSINHNNLFYQDICIDNTSFTLPLKSSQGQITHHNEVNGLENAIKFIGYPFREYSFRFIDQSIFEKVIPKIDFVFNQCESYVTTTFLKRKISYGYYIEKYPSYLLELEEYRIKDESHIASIIDNLVSSSNNAKVHTSDVEISTEEFEEFEQMLNELRYSSHKVSSDAIEASSQYLLSSNVLHFENGSYVFLPHNWRILTLKESISGTIESQSCKFENLAIGDIAVIVNVSRQSITKYLSSSGAMLTYMETLESWREILRQEREIYNNVSDLVDRLHSVNETMNLNGSPENYNVLRWLHDETMLAPAYENLKMILGLKYSVDELSKRAMAILAAKNVILKAKNKLDRAVKRKIADLIADSNKELEDNFIIYVQGIEVKGERNEIVGIERRQDLKIEYHSTMKFLK